MSTEETFECKPSQAQHQPRCLLWPRLPGSCHFGGIPQPVVPALQHIVLRRDELCLHQRPNDSLLKRGDDPSMHCTSPSLNALA